MLLYQLSCKVSWDKVMGIVNHLCHMNMNDARAGIESTPVRVFSVAVWAHFQTKANTHMHHWQNVIPHKHSPERILFKL